MQDNNLLTIGWFDTLTAALCIVAKQLIRTRERDMAVTVLTLSKLIVQQLDAQDALEGEARHA